MNATFFDIVRSLSPIQIKEFRKFISSPYFNNRRTVLKFFNQIIKYYPFFDIDINKEKIYRKVFENRKFNFNTYYIMLTHLSSLAQKFIKQKSIEINDFQINNNILQLLLRYPAGSYFKRNVWRIKSDIKRKINIDVEFIKNCCRFDRILYNYSVLNDRVDRYQVNDMQTTLIIESAVKLKISFYIDIISYYRNLLLDSSNGAKAEKFLNDFININEIENFLKNIRKKYQYYFFLDLYLKFIKTFSGKNIIANYFRYKTCFEKFKDKLTLEELSYHYENLIKFCELNLKKGKNLKLTNELNILYDKILKYGYFKSIDSKYLTINRYRDILKFIISTKNSKKLKEFIDNNSNKVQPMHFKNIYHYATSYYYFELKDYHEAIKNIMKVSFINTQIKYDLLILLLLTLYDTNELSKVIIIINNFNNFVFGDKTIITLEKNKLKQFIKFYKTLVKIKKEKLNYHILYFKRSLNRTKTLIYKDWYIEKCEELLKELRPEISMINIKAG